MDTEVSPFPHIAKIIKCKRICCSTKEGSEPEMSVRLFGTSIEYGAEIAAQIGRIIRGHWSVGNLNHRKRDAGYWGEDRGPIRNALLTVIPFEEFDSLKLGGNIAFPLISLISLISLI
ncbi:MAG: hypothetical protein ACI9E1_000317 [Cryomorphaceae bacterium]